MAIQPIDLQAIFSQIDKVGKNQSVLREGLQIQEALQQAQSQKKLEENIRSVNESQNMGDDAGKIKDEQGRKSSGQSGENENIEEEDSNPEEKKPDLIRDPSLGTIIDISG
ncbi:MAG: hypothetical protein FWH35_06825 [Treponema sp.]|nr:hypothetical protein [Treponema sp.]